MRFEGEQKVSQGLGGMGIMEEKERLGMRQDVDRRGGRFEVGESWNESLEVKWGVLEHDQSREEILNIEMREEWSVKDILRRRSL